MQALFLRPRVCGFFLGVDCQKSDRRGSINLERTYRVKRPGSKCTAKFNYTEAVLKLASCLIWANYAPLRFYNLMFCNFRVRHGGSVISDPVPCEMLCYFETQPRDYPMNHRAMVSRTKYLSVEWALAIHGGPRRSLVSIGASCGIGKGA